MALTPRQMAVIRARARAKKAKSAAEMQRPTALGGLGYQPEEETSRQAFRAGAANVPVPETQPQRPKAPTRLGAVAGQFAQSATLGQGPNILAAPYALTGQFPEAKAFYQQRLQQGAQAFPLSTAAADIAGFVAPGGAVAKGVMSAARPAVSVLARAIPSTGVTRMGGRIAAGAGLGATEGALYGGTVEAERRAMQAGQAAPTMEERGQAAFPAAALGAAVGGAFPVVGRALQPVGTAIAGQAVKAFGPGATARQAERVAQKAVRADLQRAGINNLDDFLKAAEQYQGKPVMTAELTQSMTNSLTALTRAKGTTGDKVKAILENRIQGFPERMMRDLQDATGLDPAAILDNLDDLIKSRQAVAAPEYAKAFAEPFTMTPQLRALIEGSPEAAAAFEDVQKIFQTKLAGTGKTFEDVPKLEVYDSVKKNLDERVRRLLKKGKTSQANAIADFTERFRNELDVIVPDKYKAARVAGGEAPSLREANKAGIKAFRLPFDMFKKEFAKVQGADAEAFKGAFVREIANAIEKNPTQASAILSPEFQSKLRLMFGEQAADRLATNVRNEISMRTTGARFNPNVGAVSSQALMGVPSQQADEMLAAGEATLEFAQNLMSGRWSSAVGPVINYFRRAGYTEAQLNAIGDLLTSDPQRAARLLFPNEMARLGASARGATAQNVLANPTQAPRGGRNTLAMPPEVGGAFVGGALGATQGETPQERAQNALLGAAGGAIGGRLARGAAIDQTRMGSNLGNVPKPVQKAQAEGYQGADVGEAQEWVSARSKGLDMSQGARLKRAKDQGFTITGYHGTAEDVTEFSTKPPMRFGKGKQEAIFFTEKPDIASSYAVWKDRRLTPQYIEAQRKGETTIPGIQRSAEEIASRYQEGANVMPVKLRLTQPLVVDAKGKSWSEVWDSALEQARKQNADGVVMKNVQDWGDTESAQEAMSGVDRLMKRNQPLRTVYAVFDPSNIRSTNAAFDPAKTSSANILATPPELGGAFVGGALGATQGETPEERARNALLGAAGGAIGGRLARGAAIDRTRMGSNLGNVPKPVQKAQAQGYEGADIGEAQEWVSARSKGLDMSQPARMQRAQELGFDTRYKLFHATDSDFNQFDVEKIRSDLNLGEDAIFLTDSPAVADSYLGGAYVQRDAPKIIEKNVQGVDIGGGVGRYYSKNSAVYPLYAKNLNEYEVWDMGGGSYDPVFMQRAIKEAKENGAPGIILQRVRDPGIMDTVGPQGNPRTPATVVAVFNPKDVRSVNAAFDPAKSSSANILAGVGAVGAGAAMMPRDQKKPPGQRPRG